MTRIVHTSALVIALAGSCSLVWLAGCDKNQLAPMDSKNTAPLVTQLLFSPDSVYIDGLTPANGEYTVTVAVRVKATDNDGMFEISAVTVDLLRSNGTVASSGIPLYDDGIAPDSARGDSVYSGLVRFSLTRAQAGRYQVRAAASDRQGAVSNSVSGQLLLSRRNSPPAVFNLTAPDSLTRPSTGSVLFLMTIAASDSDGLADISEVYFKSLTSSTPDTKIYLYDDGGVIPRNSVTSGDVLAGDGVFSVVVQLPSTATAGTRVFAFQSKDTFGDTSATLNHSLVVR